jgi:type IV pilus assembly protein PilM
MAKKLNSVVGIDIGSRSIKIAEIRNQGKEIVVSAIGMIETPEGAVDHTGVYNSDAVGAALKKVIGDAGVSVSHGVISVAGQASVLVRTLEVPKMNDKELADHMQWEINRNIPFSESTVVSDFKPLGGEDPASQNMDVVMAISPQSAIDTLIAVAKKAGKQLAAIDVEPLGLARSLRASYDDAYQNQTVCIVDIGHKTTAINIYRNGKLLMPRTVPIGGELFNKSIADAMGISMDAAESLKIEKGDVSGLSTAAANPFAATPTFQPYNPFTEDGGAAAPPSDEPAAATAAPVVADSDAQRVNDAMVGVLDEFVAELRRSIDYFRSRGGDVNALALCGGGAKLNGLAAFVESAIGIKCDTYDPMRHLNVNIRKVAPGYVEQHREEFAVAVGNGLHVVF